MWRSPARLLPQNVSSVDVLKSGERPLVQRSRSEAMSGMLWLDEKVLERRYACRKLCLPRSGAHASPVMLPDLSPVVETCQAMMCCAAVPGNVGILLAK